MSETEQLTESYHRVVGSRHFWERFAEYFLGHDPAVRRHFDAVPPAHRRELLQRSLTILIGHAAGSPAAQADLDGLLRPGRTGKPVIPESLYSQWLIALLKAVGECDPRFTEELEWTWRHAMERAVSDLSRRSHQLTEPPPPRAIPRRAGATPTLNARLD